MKNKDIIIKQIKKVIDPDLGIDIYSLGLIYDIDCKSDNSVTITMTFTTPFCPAAPMLKEQIRSELKNIEIDDVDIVVTFDPPWTAPKEVRIMMGL